MYRRRRVVRTASICECGVGDVAYGKDRKASRTPVTLESGLSTKLGVRTYAAVYE